MWHWILNVTGTNIPANGSKWYNFWSGFGSDLGIFGAVVIYLRHQNCHKKGCPRLGKHPYKHLKYCKKHHPAEK